MLISLFQERGKTVTIHLRLALQDQHLRLVAGKTSQTYVLPILDPKVHVSPEIFNVLLKRLFSVTEKILVLEDGGVGTI